MNKQGPTKQQRENGVAMEKQYKYDWANVPSKFMQVATDEECCFNCRVNGYVEMPVQTEQGYWDARLDSIRIGYYSELASLSPYHGDWRNSLERRPKEFGG